MNAERCFIRNKFSIHWKSFHFMQTDFGCIVLQSNTRNDFWKTFKIFHFSCNHNEKGHYPLNHIEKDGFFSLHNLGMEIEIDFWSLILVRLGLSINRLWVRRFSLETRIPLNVLRFLWCHFRLQSRVGSTKYHVSD